MEMNLDFLVSANKSGKLLFKGSANPQPPSSQSSGTGYRRITDLTTEEIVQICADENPDRFNNLIEQIQQM